MIVFIEFVLPRLGVFIAEIDAATERARLASRAEAVDLVGAAFGFGLGEELGEGDWRSWLVARGPWFAVGDGRSEVREFGGGDVQTMAILFELAAATGRLADRLAGGDIGIGCRENVADGGEEGGVGRGICHRIIVRKSCGGCRIEAIRTACR